jgi:hypothetical protein
VSYVKSIQGSSRGNHSEFHSTYSQKYVWFDLAEKSILRATFFVVNSLVQNWWTHTSFSCNLIRNTSSLTWLETNIKSGAYCTSKTYNLTPRKVLRYLVTYEKVQSTTTQRNFIHADTYIEVAIYFPSNHQRSSRYGRFCSSAVSSLSSSVQLQLVPSICARQSYSQSDAFHGKQRLSYFLVTVFYLKLICRWLRIAK